MEGGERTTKPLWERNLISNASLALENTTLKASDFEPIMAQACSGDVIYCDPTYTVAHNNNGFYPIQRKAIFSWDDQKRLANSCKSAARRGAFVIVSNAVSQRYPNAVQADPPHNRETAIVCLSPIPRYRRHVEE